VVAARYDLRQSLGGLAGVRAPPPLRSPLVPGLGPTAGLGVVQLRIGAVLRADGLDMTTAVPVEHGDVGAGVIDHHDDVGLARLHPLDERSEQRGAGQRDARASGDGCVEVPFEQHALVVRDDEEGVAPPRSTLETIRHEAKSGLGRAFAAQACRGVSPAEGDLLRTGLVAHHGVDVRADERRPGVATGVPLRDVFCSDPDAGGEGPRLGHASSSATSAVT
jgi:hypothetical protein